MTIKGIVTFNKGHVATIEKVRLGTSSCQDYHTKNQFWWNFIQKWLRNKESFPNPSFH